MPVHYSDSAMTAWLPVTWPFSDPGFCSQSGSGRWVERWPAGLRSGCGAESERGGVASGLPPTLGKARSSLLAPTAQCTTANRSAMLATCGYSIARISKHVACFRQAHVALRTVRRCLEKLPAVARAAPQPSVARVPLEGPALDSPRPVSHGLLAVPSSVPPPSSRQGGSVREGALGAG